MLIVIVIVRPQVIVIVIN